MLSRGQWLTAGVGALVAGAALLCFGPWYEAPATPKVLAALKWGGLVVAALLAAVTALRHHGDDPQRLPWLLLAFGLASYSGGQSVLAIHQLFLGVAVPFPSVGDLFFVVASALFVPSLSLFVWRAYRSGLPLGSGLEYWWPALTALGALVAIQPLVAVTIIGAGAPPLETFLNVFYPTSGFVILAPCAVMLRVGARFRGGGLLWVWVPLTAGFALITASDILFAYLTTIDVSGGHGAMDFLYTTAYLVIPRALAYQLALMRA